MIANLRDFTDMSGFDLPTEAQWEYACRAGTANWWPWGDVLDATRLNYGMKVKPDDGESDYRTTKVNDYPPQNDWGLYDVLGNVEEMCLDRYSSLTPTGNVPAVDPEGPSTGDAVVTRGGGCLHGVERNRSAWRRDAGTGCSQARSVVGVRICCTIP